MPNCVGPRLRGEAVLERVARRRAARVEIELAVDRAEMRVHGAEADDELLRHLRVGQARGRPSRAPRSRAASGRPAPTRRRAPGRPRRRAPRWLRRAVAGPRPRRTRTGFPPAALRASASTLLVGLRVARHQRHVDRRPVRVGRAEDANRSLGIAGPGRQECRRLEHDAAEPEVAELEEQRQRLRELRRRRLGVTELAVDLRRGSRAPWRTCGGHRPRAGCRGSRPPVLGPRRAVPGGRVTARP